MASDAFFPFADGMLACVEAGATAVIQPGGSMRDEEVIKAADEHGIAMVFTGIRHFRALTTAVTEKAAFSYLEMDAGNTDEIGGRRSDLLLLGVSSLPVLAGDGEGIARAAGQSGNLHTMSRPEWTGPAGKGHSAPCGSQCPIP